MHIAQVYFKDLSYDPPQYLHYSNTFVTVLFLYFWQTSVSPYYSFRSPSKSLSISDSLFFFHSLSPVPFFLRLFPSLYFSTSPLSHSSSRSPYLSIFLFLPLFLMHPIHFLFYFLLPAIFAFLYLDGCFVCAFCIMSNVIGSGASFCLWQ